MRNSDVPGIAGPTLAYWLSRNGINPAIGEIAPALRTRRLRHRFLGSRIRLCQSHGSGAELRHHGYMLDEAWVVNRKGERIIRIPAAGLFSRDSQPSCGDLTASIFRQLEGNVKTIFGDRIESLGETDSGLRVSFARAGPREFDLVVRAEGLHSRVRLTRRRSAF